MPDNTNPAVVWVTLKDIETGQEIKLVDGVVGIASAAKVLGVSMSHMSRLMRGECRYGPRNDKRLVYEFKSIPKNEYDAQRQAADNI